MRAWWLAGLVGLVACGGQTADETAEIGGSAAGSAGQAGQGQGGSGQAGQAGSGQAGSGQAGSGQAGAGQAGSGQGGSGQAGAAGKGAGAGGGPAGAAGAAGAGGALCCVSDLGCGDESPAYCVAGVCKSPAAPAGCWVDAECPQGQSCVGAAPCPCGSLCKQDSPGVCEGPMPGCCSENNDCPQGKTSEVCANGVCKVGPWKSGGPCWADSQCGAGFSCVGAFVCPCGAACDQEDKAGSCQPSGTSCCQSDLDCGDFALMYCVAGSCKLPAAPAGCWVDAECPQGLVCAGVAACPCGLDCGQDSPGVCQAPGGWGACGGPGDCGLAFDSCCGPCGLPQAGDYDAVNHQQEALHLQQVCPGGPSVCPACAQGFNPDLAAFCEAKSCNVISVSKHPISACTKDDECAVRAPQCCDCGTLDPGQYIGLRADQQFAYEAQVCGPGGGGCQADCIPSHPQGLAPYCDQATGHCRVAIAVP